MPYNGTIDLLRFLAVLGVMWIHAPEGKLLQDWSCLGRFAVPFFAATASYFAVSTAMRPNSPTIGQFFRYRSLRIYLIFLGWSVIYFAARLFAYQFGWAKNPFELLDIYVLRRGTAPHLWFLTFVALGGLLVYALGKFAKSRNVYLGIGLMCLLLGDVTGGVRIRDYFPDIRYTPLLIYQAAPALFWGAAIRLAEERFPQLRSMFKRFAPLSLVVVLIAYVECILLTRSTAAENMCGTALLLWGLGQDFKPWGTWNRQLGQATFGLYAVHMLCVDGLQVVMRAFGISGEPVADLMVFAGTAIGAWVLYWLLNQFAASRWLLTTREHFPAGVLDGARKTAESASAAGTSFG
jgi:surface polysaccharide O-acyltransferase-like enzyme